MAFASLALTLLASAGCKDDKVSPTTGEVVTDLQIKKGQLFVLDLDGKLNVSNVKGGREAIQEIKQFANHNQLLLWSHPRQKHVFRFGVTAPAASYGESSYERVRARSDHVAVYLPTTTLRLIKDNGTTIELRVADTRIEPRGEVSPDGVISDDFVARLRGNFTITHGDTGFSGAFDGEWSAQLDDSPPEVTVISPPRGLITGSFDIYFDEPVRANNLPERIYLRRKDQTKMRIRIAAVDTDIQDYFTHIRVDANDLLPFNDRLTLAVGTGFTDLAGHTLDRPHVEIIDTPDFPPLMNNVGHDFDAARQKPEFQLQGDVEIVSTYLGIKPYRGRLLKIRPMAAGRRASSALVTRMRVADDAEYVQVRVLKIASNRDPQTPCLRYVVAHINNGLLWNVECGPTDVPSGVLTTPDGDELFVTPWTHLNIKVDGQRGREIIIVLEAAPLSPHMNPDSEPVFLVDMIRTVWTGEDPTRIEGDLKVPAEL